MKLKTTNILIFLLLMSVISFAQTTYNLGGKVLGQQDGLPIPGVNVIIVGSNSGTTTDFDGNYVIKVKSGDILKFSYLGYKTQQITFKDQKTINITFEEDQSLLDEVVVVGYGTQKRSDITGSVASVSKERLQNVPNQNIAQAIQGSVAGVVVSTSGAGANPNQEILIRGRNSITANNGPLVVLDGIPYGGSLNDINPNDIQNIEILKDASSTAIYGSRAANGVILVTSKKGKTGKATFTYNGFYGIQDFVKLPDLMDGDQFYAFKAERDPGSFTISEQEIFDAGEGVDWLDLGLRNGYSSEHNIAISGATKNVNYYISGGITDVTGLAINDDFKRMTTRINLDVNITDWLTVGTRTQLSHNDLGGVAVRFDTDQGLFRLNPLTRPFDANGDLNIFPWEEDPYFQNPLTTSNILNNDRSYRIFTNNYVAVDVPFIKGLKYQLNTGVTLNFIDRETYWGRDTSQGFVRNGQSQTVDQRSDDILVENILTYNKTFGKHVIGATALYSYQNTSSEQTVINANGFPNDFLTYFAANQAGDRNIDYSGSFSSTVLLSQMLRLNYNYDSRYLLTLTGRRDGYSGFGLDEKYGLFPTVGLAWNLHNERFMEDSFLNQLKFRLSYGQVGNQAVNPYQTIATLGESSYVDGSNTLSGFTPNRLGTPNLGWETTATFNTGLEFSLFSSKLTGTMDYYVANTTDLLLNRSVSSIQGITNIIQNIGEVRNTGFELSLTGRPVSTPDFQWTTSGNVSFVKNEIVSLYGILDETGQETDDIANEWFIGQPIRVNYGQIWDGIWQENETDLASQYATEPGFVKLRDAVRDEDGDGVDDFIISPEDRQIQGQLDPKVLWGWTNTFNYKNLSLNIFVHGVHGVTRENPFVFDDANTGAGVRRNVTVKDFWTPDNPNAFNPINRDNSNLQQGQSAIAFQNADFIRLKDVTLAYDLGKYVEGISKLQIYMTGRNLVTITDWTGLDPELGNQVAVPLQKQFLLGVNLAF